MVEETELPVVTGLQRLLFSELSLGLQAAIPPNMSDRDTFLRKHTSDQKPAMARSRIFFRTKHSNPELTEAFFQALQTVLKKCRLGYAGIKNMAVMVVILTARRTAAQFFPHEKVLDSIFG